jgi:hypothetical protein
MHKIAILGPLQQQAEALSTQFKPLYVLFNDKMYVRNRDEMISTDVIKYKKYSALNAKQEIFFL